MEHVSHKCGISVGNAWFSDLNYADDVMLFAERQEILVSALQSMEEESSKFGLHILWALMQHSGGLSVTANMQLS